jgi:hypothetical protein
MSIRFVVGSYPDESVLLRALRTDINEVIRGLRHTRLELRPRSTWRNKHAIRIPNFIYLSMQQTA